MVCSVVNLWEEKMKKSSVIVALALLLIVMLGILSANADSLISGFEIYPNPMDRYTQITVSVERPVEMQITIQDLRGEVVKDLYGGTVEKDVVLYWNRQANDGSFAPAGEYNVVLSFNGRYTSVKKTLILR